MTYAEAQVLAACAAVALNGIGWTVTVGEDAEDRTQFVEFEKHGWSRRAFTPERVGNTLQTLLRAGGGL